MKTNETFWHDCVVICCTVRTRSCWLTRSVWSAKNLDREMFVSTKFWIWQLRACLKVPMSIATQKLNILASFRQNTHLKSNIKFTWLTFSWTPVNCKSESFDVYPNFPAPRQDDGVFEVWYSLTKFWWKKSLHLLNGTGEKYFCKINKNSPCASAPFYRLTNSDIKS